MIKKIVGLGMLNRARRERIDAPQEVVIRERDGCVHLDLAETIDGASLTPGQARELAAMLLAAADRVCHEKEGSQ
jgi:hypothetical protein